MDEKRIITIMGPSGAGKTTIGTMISNTYNFGVPMHCTTRSRRDDDINGFYRYLSYDKFSEYVKFDKYLLWSGDSEIIKKEYGNFYGILIDDYRYVLNEKKKIILYVSYKDLERIVYLKEVLRKRRIKVQILNLTYYDFSIMKERLTLNPLRKHTLEDLEKRVKIAYEDEQIYGADVRRYADVREYTDTMTVNETFKSVSKKLELKSLHK